MRVLHFCLLAVLLSACSSIAGPIPTATVTATRKPLPTQTPRPVTLKACVTDTTIRIRNGPGTDYEVISGLVSGTCFTILGRNQDSTWAYIVTNDKITGWVAAWLLTIDGDLSRVSIQYADGVLPTAWVNPFAVTTNTPSLLERFAVTSSPAVVGGNCSPSYPTVCIPPGPPDLDCGDISYKRFRVLSPDPHGFDADGDGVGCEW